MSSDTNKLLNFLVEELKAFRQETNERFDSIDRRFEGIEQRFEAIEQRVETMEKNIELELHKMLGYIDGRMTEQRKWFIIMLDERFEKLYAFLHEHFTEFVRRSELKEIAFVGYEYPTPKTNSFKDAPNLKKLKPGKIK